MPAKTQTRPITKRRKEQTVFFYLSAVVLTVIIGFFAYTLWFKPLRSAINDIPVETTRP